MPFLCLSYFLFDWTWAYRQTCKITPIQFASHLDTCRINCGVIVQLLLFSFYMLCHEVWMDLQFLQNVTHCGYCCCCCALDNALAARGVMIGLNWSSSSTLASTLAITATTKTSKSSRLRWQWRSRRRYLWLDADCWWIVQKPNFNFFLEFYVMLAFICCCFFIAHFFAFGFYLSIGVGLNFAQPSYKLLLLLLFLYYRPL